MAVCLPTLPPGRAACPTAEGSARSGRGRQACALDCGGAGRGVTSVGYGSRGGKHSAAGAASSRRPLDVDWLPASLLCRARRRQVQGRASAEGPHPTAEAGPSLEQHEQDEDELEANDVEDRVVLGEEMSAEGTNGSLLPERPPFWLQPSAAEVVRSFQLEHQTDKGRLVIQPLDKQHEEATIDLLAVCFADSIDAASFLGYIRTQIVKYLAEQQRFFDKGQGVCLVALWYPAGAPDAPSPPEPVLVGTVSLAFALRSMPRFPTLNIPSNRANAYLSNMAVQPSYRRQGMARQLLRASEELAVTLGKRALYLHVRFVDEIPQRVYTAADYTVVAQDTVLSWLFLQRRRSLMRKQLHPKPTEVMPLTGAQEESSTEARSETPLSGCCDFEKLPINDMGKVVGYCLASTPSSRSCQRQRRSEYDWTAGIDLLLSWQKHSIMPAN